MVAALVSSSTLAEEFPGVDDETSAAMKEAVVKDFLDPESARFRGVVVAESGKVLCGFVNAKNSFGGYVGFRPFDYSLYTGEAKTYDPPEKNDAFFKLTEIVFKQIGCEKALGAPLLNFFL